MPHDTPLITTIVAALVLAFLLGAIVNRARVPPLVGYLLAGVVAGPYTPGFVADQALATQLAELGVILLMFGVGLHFSLKDLLSVRAVAVPGALLRIAGGTAMGLGLALMMGWSIGAGLIFGLALSVASTVVLLRALQERHLVDSERGRIAVGWVIVEDVAMVLALVLIPVLAAIYMGTPTGPSDPFVDLTQRLLGFQLGLWGLIGVTLIKLAAFAGFMLIVGRRIIPLVLHWTAHTGSRELFRLAVLAIALGVAAGAASLFGVSLALGAFFAGMILSESELSHRAAEETLPLRDAFSVLFFVSIGMLFDPSIIVRDPLEVLATVLIVIFGKSIVAYLVIRAARKPAAMALAISANLAQIGEFSFILAALGMQLGILPQEGSDLILAGALISMVLNPIVVWVAERRRPAVEPYVRGGVEPGLEARDSVGVPEAILEAGPAEGLVATGLSDHIVLIGFGRVGGVVGRQLKAEGATFLVIEDGETRMAAAREADIEVVAGNGASPDVLHAANVAGARAVVVAIPNAFEAGQAVAQARKLNAKVRIIARAHLDEEVDYLEKLGADRVIMGEREIGLGMIDWVKHGEAKEDVEAAPSGVTGSRLAPEDNFIAQEMAERASNSGAQPTPIYTSPETMPLPPHVRPGAEGPAEPPEEVPSLGEMLNEAAAGPDASERPPPVAPRIPPRPGAPEMLRIAPPHKRHVAPESNKSDADTGPVIIMPPPG